LNGAPSAGLARFSGGGTALAWVSARFSPSSVWSRADMASSG
jgi:hypothetical protein